MEFSIKKHWEIIFLYFHRLEPKLSIRVITKELQYSRNTVKTWIHRYQKIRDIQDEERRGRKKKTSEREDLDIVTIAKKNRTKTLAEISISIDKQGTTISKAIVRRRLNEQSLYKLQLLKKPLLSDTHRDNRLEWAKKNKKTDWSKVIFTDEITVSQFSQPKKVWRYKNKKVKAPTVKHSAKVHVYRYFLEKRFENIYCFIENLNSELLYTIYKKTLLSSARNFFREDNNSWKLQEDNDPKHTSEKVQNWKDENVIKRISWLSQSLYLNPMENV